MSGYSQQSRNYLAVTTIPVWLEGDLDEVKIEILRVDYEVDGTVPC